MECRLIPHGQINHDARCFCPVAQEDSILDGQRKYWGNRDAFTWHLARGDNRNVDLEGAERLAWPERHGFQTRKTSLDSFYKTLCKRLTGTRTNVPRGRKTRSTISPVTYLGKSWLSLGGRGAWKARKVDRHDVWVTVQHGQRQRGSQWSCQKHRTGRNHEISA